MPPALLLPPVLHLHCSCPLFCTCPGHLSWACPAVCWLLCVTKGLIYLHHRNSDLPYQIPSVPRTSSTPHSAPAPQPTTIVASASQPAGHCPTTMTASQPLAAPGPVLLAQSGHSGPMDPLDHEQLLAPLPQVTKDPHPWQPSRDPLLIPEDPEVPPSEVAMLPGCPSSLAPGFSGPGCLAILPCHPPLLPLPQQPPASHAGAFFARPSPAFNTGA